MKKRLIFILLFALACFLINKPFDLYLGDNAFAEVFADGESDAGAGIENTVSSGVVSSGVEGFPYTKIFTISAYYSPLPCQNRYSTGSYEGDIRLNGNGVHGADGTDVYPGMIAAPRTYAFGTKMDIPSIGIVAVHDRGGAIVASNLPGYYDRLDVWMGYGDKGLKRALNWGKRTVEVVVYGVNDSISEQITLAEFSADESNRDQCGNATPEPTVELADVFVPEVTTETSVEPVASKPALKEPVVETVAVASTNSVSVGLAVDLKPGDSGSNVRHLQTELKRLNFYRGEITGFYGDLTEHAVFKFQQSQKLVAVEDSPFAGKLGPKTRDRINEIVASRNYNTGMIAEATQKYQKTLVANAGQNDQQIPADRNRKRILTAQLQFGMKGPEVSALQKFLKEKGFFDGGLITEYFGPVTLEAVIEFQISNNLIKSKADKGAGVIDLDTLEFINTLS